MHAPGTHPERANDCFLRFCSMLNYLTTATGAMSGIYSLACAAIMVEEPWLQHTLYCYVAALSLMVCLAESEWEWFLTRVPFLNSWIFRGAFIGFVGNVMWFLPVPDLGFFDLMQSIMSLYLLAAGGLYTCLGLTCFRQLKLRQMKRVAEQKRMRMEMEQLQSQKHEIERLMADTATKLQKL